MLVSIAPICWLAVLDVFGSVLLVSLSWLLYWYPLIQGLVGGMYSFADVHSCVLSVQWVKSFSEASLIANFIFNTQVRWASKKKVAGKDVG